MVKIRKVPAALITKPDQKAEVLTLEQLLAKLEVELDGITNEEPDDLMAEATQVVSSRHSKKKIKSTEEALNGHTREGTSRRDRAFTGEKPPRERGDGEEFIGLGDLCTQMGKETGTIFLPKLVRHWLRTTDIPQAANGRWEFNKGDADRIRSQFIGKGKT